MKAWWKVYENSDLQKHNVQLPLNLGTHSLFNPLKSSDSTKRSYFFFLQNICYKGANKHDS